MKKLSKVLAFLSSAAIAAGTVSSISAGAIYQWVDSNELLVNPNPDKFVEYKSDYKEITYRRIDNPYNFYSYDSFKYNYLNLSVDIGADWESVYEKYADTLDFDSVHSWEDTQRNMVCINMYDMLSEGDDPRNPASIENKRNDIELFCAELNANGILRNAMYNEFQAEIIDWFIDKYIELNGFTGTIDDIKAVTDKYTESAIIKMTDNNCTIYIDDTDNQENNPERMLQFDDFMSMYDEIDKLDENDKISKRYSALADSRTVYAESVDILAAIGDGGDGFIYGDLTADGSIGIADAIVMNKAVTGIVTLNSDQIKAADVNGDCSVNSDDLDLMLNFLVDNITSFPIEK
ncbi:MAG: dockerin type I repeat-containing protein [Ruminococcus sp.]|nr:dockerin type I repeat-containing protein [Ruminococcus sp.]